MVDLARFAPETMETLVRAKAIASQAGAGTPTPPTPLALGLALLCRSEVTARLIERIAAHDPALLTALRRVLQEPPGPAPAEAVEPPPETLAILDAAQRLADAHKPARVEPLHLWCAVFASGDAALRDWLQAAGLDAGVLHAAGQQALEGRRPPGSDALPASAQRVLGRYTENWTAYALAGKLRPAIGRREIFERLCEQLLRLGKRNVVLTGEGGVGKTFLVRHLAWALVHAPETIPARLRGCSVYSLDLLKLRMGAGMVGELEGRTRELIGVLEEHADRIILFIDELHTIVGAPLGGSGALDLANAFKPLLAEGAVRCIGATTPLEYNRYIAGDPALARRFADLRVPPLSPESTRDLLQAERPRFAQHAGCAIEDTALDAVIDLARRYLPNRQFPDKAVDLLDAACAHAAARGLTAVDAGTVKRVLARDLELPAVDDPEMSVARIERALSVAVVGQGPACAAIARALVRGFRQPAEYPAPRAVLFLTGPSRVGKTLAAQTIGRILCSRSEQFLRIDMNEYLGAAGGHGGERAAHRLLGPPPPYMGYERGGILTNQALAYPASVILLDEFEKADAQVQDLFLGIFDRGVATDGLGRIVSFRDCYFVLTSNLLPEDRRELADEAALRRALLAGRALSAELLNRLTAVVAFALLDVDALQELSRRAFDELRRACLKDRGVQVRVEPDERSLHAAIAQAAMRAGTGHDAGLGFLHATAPARAGGDAQSLQAEFLARVRAPVESLLDTMGADGELPDWLAIRVANAAGGEISTQVVAGEGAIQVQPVSLTARLLLIGGDPAEVATLAALPQARWDAVSSNVALVPLLDRLPPEEVPILVVEADRHDLLAEAAMMRRYHPTLGLVRRLAPGQPEAPDGDAPAFTLSASGAFAAYIQARLHHARTWQRQQRQRTLDELQTAQGQREAVYALVVAPLRAEGGLQG